MKDYKNSGDGSTVSIHKRIHPYSNLLEVIYILPIINVKNHTKNAEKWYWYQTHITKLSSASIWSDRSTLAIHDNTLMSLCSVQIV